MECKEGAHAANRAGADARDCHQEELRKDVSECLMSDGRDSEGDAVAQKGPLVSKWAVTHLQER
jgi:hypothetical protein